MAIDWTKFYQKYRGLWLALKKDEKTLIASASTAKEVYNISQKKGYKNPILTRIPTSIVTHVGHGI